jgi:transcriptional regulator with XRE-family HTH domain
LIDLSEELNCFENGQIKLVQKKSFISRIENGKSDIQLSTLYRLLEFGLGKKVELTVR